MRHHLITRLAAIVALTLLLTLPAATLAHAELDTPTPADGATVEGTPPEIEGTFTQDVAPEGSSVQLRGPDGTVIAEGSVVDGEPRRMAIDPVPVLAPGEYEVRWTTFSAEDGEGPIRGTWTFTVTAEPTPEPTLAPTPGVTDTPTTEPTTEPTPAPTVAPSPSPSGDGDPAASEGDVLLPIIAALAIVAIAGVVLLNRRGRATGA